jgi:hypothetical protein
MNTINQINSIKKAYETYKNRKSRKEYPEGTFDNARRWYPSDTEERNCCKKIRSPSKAFPHSLLDHCKTAKHIGNLYNISPKYIKNIKETIKEYPELLEYFI